MKVILRNLSTGEIKHVNYPRHDNGPVIGLSSNLRYYVTENIDYTDSFDSNLYHLKLHEEYTDEPSSTYPHIYVRRLWYELELNDVNQIIENLNNSVGDYLETCFPYWKQLKYLNRYVTLTEIQVESGLMSSEAIELEYIKSVRLWFDRVRLSRDEKEYNLVKNNVLPDFQWEAVPTTSLTNYK